MSRLFVFFICSLVFEHSIAATTELVILHTNDIHCRYDGIDTYGSRCVNKTKCFGGISRLSEAIKSIRKKEQNVVLLDGGDILTGTLWYMAYQGKASAQFFGELNYDVIVPGNHDFDGGPTKTQYFYNNITSNGNTEVVASNIKSNNAEWNMIKSHVIKQINNTTRIGICGYTLPSTSSISYPGNNIEFLDEVQSVRNCTQSLKNNGINIIIALGHAGITMDLKIAREVEDVDVVVGGHTNTFLYTGTPPSSEKPYGPYPMVVKSGNRTKAVVQDFAFGKYLGFLKCTFNEDGDLVAWNGNPILLNESIQEDPNLQNRVDKLRSKVDVLENEYVGRSEAVLEASDCKHGECLFGNLVANAMRFVANDTGSIALISSNTWAGTIKKENITYGDLFDCLPYQNDLFRVTIKGRFLREVLQISASFWNKGHFLQVSGINVTYDGQKKNRLLRVQVETEGGTLKGLVDDEEYKVVVSSYMFLYNTYKVLRDNAITSYNLRIKEIDAVQTYIKSHQPLRETKDGRISVIGTGESQNSSACRLHFIYWYITILGLVVAVISP